MSTYLGYEAVAKWGEQQVLYDRPPTATPLIQWLNAEKRSRPRLIVAARQPQTFVHLTPGVGYHWYDDEMSFADICAMTSKLHVDYVVVSGLPAFLAGRRFGAAFRPIGAGGGGVYAARVGGGCAP